MCVNVWVSHPYLQSNTCLRLCTHAHVVSEYICRTDWPRSSCINEHVNKPDLRVTFKKHCYALTNTPVGLIRYTDWPPSSCINEHVNEQTYESPLPSINERTYTWTRCRYKRTHVNMYTTQSIHERTYTWTQHVFRWTTYVEDALVFMDTMYSLNGQFIFLKWTTHVEDAQVFMDNTSSLNGQHLFFK